MLGSDITAIISGAVGAVALLTLIIRGIMLLYTTEPRTIPALNEVVAGLLSFPYAIAFSSLIATHAGYDATPALYLAALLAHLSFHPLLPKK